MYQLGCNQATSNNTSNYNSMVILDFGGIVNDSGYQQEVFSGTVLQPIQVTELDRVFEIYPTLPDALQGGKAKGPA